jgi:hypothetical protein
MTEPDQTAPGEPAVMEPTQSPQAGIPVARLNHAVLHVRDLDRSVDFYRRAFSPFRRSHAKAA